MIILIILILITNAIINTIPTRHILQFSSRERHSAKILEEGQERWKQEKLSSLTDWEDALDARAATKGGLAPNSIVAAFNVQ